MIYLSYRFGAGYILSFVALDNLDMGQVSSKVLSAIQVVPKQDLYFLLVTMKFIEASIPSARLSHHHGRQFDVWVDRAECVK